jgi:3-oxoacyl-[acyl-carrier protein] reductase
MTGQKAALATGSSRGIGAVIAARLADGGRIVVISSTATVSAVGHELGPRQITINSVLPGATPHSRVGSESPERRGHRAGHPQTPLGRISGPDDIADDRGDRAEPWCR